MLKRILSQVAIISATTLLAGVLLNSEVADAAQKKKPAQSQIQKRPAAALPVAAAATAPSESPSEPIPVVENPLTVVEAKFVPQNMGPGGTTELVLNLSLVDHYKAYVDRFKVKVVKPDTYKVDVARLSPTVQFMDVISKKMKDGIKGKGELRATVEVPQTVAPGEQEVEFDVTYQACTTEHCLFPKTVQVRAKLMVTSGPGGLATLSPSHVAPSGGSGAATVQTDTPTAAATSGTEKSSFEKAMEKGILYAFMFAFLGGILTSLTPCVYPMIPITLAVIGARAKGQNRFRSFSLSVTYVLGIALTYSLLGVVAASTGAMFGSALSNIYVVTGIALLFIAMGLSMYGLFEIQAPAFIRDRLGAKQTGAGYAGAFTTGLISGIVASPCIGPVLVAILAWIAASGSRALGFGLLFTFAMGMGILLIVLGTFSHMLNKVPKSGNWMEVVKFTFGTAMVAMALYYIEPLYPAWLFHACVATALILIASVYGAFESNNGLTGTGRVRKGAMIVTFVIGLFFALSAVSDRAGIQLTSGAGIAGTNSTDQATKLKWQPYSDDLVAAAMKDGKPVLVDFYADWCAACKEFEHLTFPDARVRELSEKFTLLKIDATEDSAEIQRLKKKYAVIGLPTMIFYDTTGKVRTDLTVTGFENADLFSGRMKSALGASRTAAND